MKVFMWLCACVLVFSCLCIVTYALMPFGYANSMPSVLLNIRCVRQGGNHNRVGSEHRASTEGRIIKGNERETTRRTKYAIENTRARSLKR